MISKRLFRKVNISTIIAVYVLIMVGSIVRSTGSGMGCPDWPKCFGGYIPPISASSLPTDYKEIYLEKRLEKNERLISTLNRLGFEKAALKLSTSPSVKLEEDFSPSKAWIEYINRLIGVLIGFFILANTISSLSYRKEKAIVVTLSILSLILVLFIGWTGSLVVSTNLLPGFVTFHMAFVFLLLGFLLFSHFLVREQTYQVTRSAKTLIATLFVLFIPQLFVGTQVREAVDSLMLEGVVRTGWMDRMSFDFYFHRSYSLLLLALMVAIAFRLRKSGDKLLKNLSNSALALMLISAISGAVMYYFDVPSTMQPLHLLLATILFGILFYLLLLTVKTTPKAVA